MDGEDVEAIKAKSEALTQASHKLAEAMYQQSAQEGQGAPGAEAGGQAAGGDAPNADDDVVDADFEEVKDEDKK
jgi:molecular chaperone DnaK